MLNLVVLTGPVSENLYVIVWFNYWLDWAIRRKG